MFVRWDGPASAQKETRIHTHAGVPKTSWERTAGWTRVQPPKDFSVAGPRFILNVSNLPVDLS